MLLEANALSLNETNLGSSGQIANFILSGDWNFDKL
jgi:hypothetical protein